MEKIGVKARIPARKLLISLKAVESDLNLQKSIKFGVNHNRIASSLVMNLSLISLEMMGKITFGERQAKVYQLDAQKRLLSLEVEV